MLDLPLDACNNLASIALEPAPVEVFGDRPELDEEVVGEIFRLDLAALLAPQAEEGGLVVAQDDAGVRAADKGPTIRAHRKALFGSCHLTFPKAERALIEPVAF